MRREIVLVLLASGGLVAACGDVSGDALSTLPPIKTTTTTTTTTISPYTGRIFYRVKPGDFLADIAARYQVTVGSIMELNKLTTDVLQVDQELEIPNNERVDETLPPLSTAPSTTEP